MLPRPASRSWLRQTGPRRSAPELRLRDSPRRYRHCVPRALADPATPARLHREPQVRRHHHIVRRCTHRYLNRPAIQRKHQRSIHRAFACRQVQPAGRAHLHACRRASVQSLLCDLSRSPSKRQAARARPFDTSSAPDTVASATPTVPIDCCATHALASTSRHTTPPRREKRRHY